MGDTKIDWCNKVWNPMTGCTRVSEGCRNCYAATMAKRLAGMNSMHWLNGRTFDQVMTHPDKLEEPRQWKKPRVVFVDSMGDLFHKDVPDEFIRQVFDVMAMANWHQFLILTKRGQRMAEMSVDLGIPKNVWLGVSIEDQQSAYERIPWLWEIDHPKLFVSAEPLLGPVKLPMKFHLSTWLKWLIIGGESGRGVARPCDPQWVRDLIYQVQPAGIPVFFKQWGEWIHRSQLQWSNIPFTVGQFPEEYEFCCVGKTKAGHVLDGLTYHEIPESIQAIMGTPPLAETIRGEL
jgi:protein gp37